MVFVCGQEVPVGQVVSGKVMALEDFGMIVELAKNIRGLVPPMHLADVKLKSPGKKYAIGSEVCLGEL